MPAFDAIVLGLGAMGSAAALSLVRRGHHVLGFEQFALGHRRGSSHGHTRIIRTAYYEAPEYVPLVRRSFELWRELEHRTGRALLVPAPCLTVGKPESDLIEGVRRAAAEHDLPVELLEYRELTERYAQFRFDPGHVGAVESNAGLLRVEECVAAFQSEAITTGRVEFRIDEPVLGWKSAGSGIEVATANGTHSAAKLMICAGAWATRLLSDIGVSLAVMRQVQHWFQPVGPIGSFCIPEFPIFLIDGESGTFYGVPDLDGRGVKCAEHYGAPELPGPESVSFDVDELDRHRIAGFVRATLPGLDPVPNRSEACLYTLSPDRHFVLDVHPRCEHAFVATGFSGHGFKFAPAMGEVMADWYEGHESKFDLRRFRLSRFA